MIILKDKHWKIHLSSFSGPNGNESKQPVYPGFERDVLKTVADYYQRLKEPLLTFHLYEVFVNILSECLTMWIHLWYLCTATDHQLPVCSFCPACMFALWISTILSSFLCRSAAGAGGSHWGSSAQLSLTATAQPKTPPAFTASNGPGLPESPPASTQRRHCHPHTGTHTYELYATYIFTASNKTRNVWKSYKSHDNIRTQRNDQIHDHSYYFNTTFFIKLFMLWKWGCLP